MKCPYCGRDMLKGVIQGRNALNWSINKHIFSDPDLHSDITPLCKGNRFTGFFVTAYNCISCNKVIIDYGSPEDDQ